MIRRILDALAVVAFASVMIASPYLTDQVADASAAARPSTHAKFYSLGVFARVARYRGLPISERMASVPDCGRIGQYVTASVNGHVDTYLVADCSDPTKKWQRGTDGRWRFESDRDRHIRDGLVVEINYSAARAYFPKGEGRAPAYIIRFAPSAWSSRGAR